MSDYIPNSFQVPNAYVDKLMFLLTPSENVVLFFVLREIFGWKDGRASRRKRIALSVIESGKRRKKDGQPICYGTGLSRQTICDALKNLCEFGILRQHGSTQDGTEYEITTGERIDMATLGKRYQQQLEKSQQRTAQARKSKAARNE